MIACKCSSLRSYTLSQWKSWGSVGSSTTWTCENMGEIKIGDILLVTGVVSDRNNIGISVHAKVTAKSVSTGTGYCTCTSIALIYGDTADTGRKGD